MERGHSGYRAKQSVAAFLFWRAVMGLTEALYFPAALGVIAFLHPDGTRSKALGAHMSAQYTGILTGGWLGGWMADHVGWRSGFFWLGAAGVAYAIVLGLYFRKAKIRPSHITAVAVTPLDVFRARCFLALLAAFFGFCAISWMLYAWLPSFLYERFHLSMTQSGLTATLYLQTSCAAGVLTGGALADRLVARWGAARFYIVVIGILAACPFAWLTFTVHSLLQMKLASAAFGFFAGLMAANVFGAAYDVVAELNYGFSTGALNTAGGLAGGAAILSVGLWKASAGMDGLMLCAALFSVVTAGGLIITVWTDFAVDRESSNPK
jgi:predicted MFS family arabinose efflux permease